MTRSGVASAPDGLRSELIFLPPDGSLTRFDDGFVLLKPSNPTYWWGNSVRFDGPPGPDDYERWMSTFDARVRAIQPASLHHTFGWDGSVAGIVAPFVEHGFDHFALRVLTAGPETSLAAPHVDATAARRTLAEPDDWDALHSLLVETREVEKHSATGYGLFAKRRIDGWRALVDAGQGAWFGAFDGGRLSSALGVFVENEPGVDGRRVGRYQHVTTRVDARRRGFAGTLVVAAARFAFDVLRADTLLILADANDAALRVYASVGFVPSGRQHGLERGGV